MSLDDALNGDRGCESPLSYNKNNNNNRWEKVLFFDHLKHLSSIHKISHTWAPQIDNLDPIVNLPFVMALSILGSVTAFIWYQPSVKISSYSRVPNQICIYRVNLVKIRKKWKRKKTDHVIITLKVIFSIMNYFFYPCNDKNHMFSRRVIMFVNSF